MAVYKIYDTGSGAIFNVVEWDGVGSFTLPTFHSMSLYTGSLTGSDQWTGSGDYSVTIQAGLFFGELTGAASGSFTGSLTGSFNNYSGSLGWIYSFPTGSWQTGSFTGSFTGSLEGSASYAISSSFATTASYVLGGAGATVTNAGDNRIITSDGTSTGLVGESNLSFDSVNLRVTGSMDITAGITMNSSSLNNPLFKGYYETMVSKSVSADYAGGIVQIDLSLGNIYRINLTANVADFNITKNPTALQAGSFTLIYIGDGTPRTVSWGTEVTWPGGAPSVTTAAGNMDIYSFFTVNSGTEYVGYVLAQNQSGLI
jgi:hypothetical protein